MEDLSDADEHREQELARARRAVAMFERMYGLSSNEMETRVAAGELDETDEICQWQFYVGVVRHVSQA